MMELQHPFVHQLAAIKAALRAVALSHKPTGSPRDDISSQINTTHLNMKAILFVCIALFGAASAGLLHHPVAHVVRTPSLDSAVVHSSRVGGNFAYSTAESHAYAAAAPVVHHVAPVHHVAAAVHHAPVVEAHHTVVAHGPAVVAAAPVLAGHHGVVAGHHGVVAAPVLAGHHGVVAAAVPAVAHHSVVAHHGVHHGVLAHPAHHGAVVLG
ncbi:histidine-rich protein PFHRP-III-like isoform X2 [Ischnura elegans]|uniref:histidine-rich protein PFHRP-III-like isoform X2 n=1 Tax=Ischnura elegans TaxID=197161 RepID=UPI001ED86CF9|nr:histidine-rich protein PFHRP-III-like isoform X2 [Ischnura elegans]